MLFLEVPPFDVLTSQTEPYTGFGDVIVDSECIERQFRETETQARKRISQIFNVQFEDSSTVADLLEHIVQQMWSDGWQPEGADVNLFTTDFGSVLTETFHRHLNGLLVFRSPTDLSHMSVWWPATGIEVFCFHKTYKRLLNEDGESIAFFAAQLARLLHT